VAFASNAHQVSMAENCNGLTKANNKGSITAGCLLQMILWLPKVLFLWLQAATMDLL
jgi:hypothetical protein